VVRTFAPVVAGISSMRYVSFLLYDVLGSFLWAASITYLGYYGGAFLQSHGVNVETIVMPIVLLALLVSLGSPLLHLFKDKKNRSMVVERLKRLFKQPRVG
jgi:membrane-associated protein